MRPDIGLDTNAATEGGRGEPNIFLNGSDLWVAEMKANRGSGIYGMGNRTVFFS